MRTENVSTKKWAQVWTWAQTNDVDRNVLLRSYVQGKLSAVVSDLHVKMIFVRWEKVGVVDKMGTVGVLAVPVG